jgi:acyl-homoserine lactone acylase PvdQ
MEKMRRISHGRLSELAGSSTLDLDKMLRIMSFHHRGKIAEKSLPDHFRPLV